MENFIVCAVEHFLIRNFFVLEIQFGCHLQKRVHTKFFPEFYVSHIFAVNPQLLGRSVTFLILSGFGMLCTFIASE